MQRLLAWMALTAVIFAGGPVSLGDDSLGTIRLRLDKVGDEKVKPDPAPRLAVFLIDCSDSMDNAIGDNGGDLDPRTKRSDAVYTALRKRLAELARNTPGIEVRIRFFHDTLDGEKGNGTRDTRWSPIAGVVDDEASVASLMNRIPINQPRTNKSVSGVKDINAFTLAPGTSLYRSGCTVIEQMFEEHARRRFGWMFFGVFSDGADMAGGKTSKDLDVALKKFRAAGPGFEGFTWKVGRDAQSVDYGTQMKTGDIGQNIPKPPPPRPRFELRPTADQPTHVDFDRLATPGSHRISFRVDGPVEVLQGLHTDFQLGADTPFRLQTSNGSGYAHGPVLATLDLPPAADVTKGVSFTLRLAATGTAEAPFSIQGEPEFTFTFKASRTLPAAEWQADVPEHVRGGDPARCVISPGVVTDPVWTFVGPAERSVESHGLVVAPVLEKGTWTVSFGATADSGQPVSRSFGVIEVIEADFALQPQAVAVPGGSPAEVTIVPNPGAADSRYDVSLDGVPLAVAAPRIVIPAQSLTSVGRHVLSVTSISRTGDYSWTHDATIDVLFAPRIEILSSDYHEGAKEAVASVYVAGDVGDAVMIRIDGREPSRIPVIFTDTTKTDRSAQLRVAVPTETIGQAFDLEVLPAKADACAPSKIRIEGRPADVSCRLISPLDGSGIAISAPPSIEIEPTGGDCEDVGDVSFEIGFRRGGDGDAIKAGPTATKAAEWRVALPPDLMPGPIEVHARPIGGRLLPQAFPQGKEWLHIGTLHVAPQMLWISVKDADPPSGPPTASGESAAIGPVRPGKPVTLELRDVPKGTLSGVKWTMGPLAGDPQFEQPLQKTGGQDVLVLNITPKAVGVLPLRAEVQMVDGVAVPPALASLVVEARRIQLTPSVETAGTGAAARTPNRLAATSGTPSAAARPFSVSGDILFHPGIDGDFLDATVGVFEKDAAADAAPLWSQTFGQESELIRIPYAALPRVDAGKCRRDLEIRMTIRPYPGYPFPVPSAPPVPFSLLATKHWGWFCLLLPLISAAMWWLSRAFVGHELSAATLLFDVDPLPDPKMTMRSLSAGKLRIDGRDVEDKAFPTLKSSFLPWRLFGRREARIPLELMAKILAKKPEREPRVAWILNEPRRAGHTLFVTGSWQAPFEHTGEGGGVLAPNPPKGWLGVNFNSTVWRENDGGDERVSETQKIWVPSAEEPTDTLYYRLYWSRFHDPFAKWRWAMLAPWLMSIVALAWLCNFFCRS